ncbi:MAG TPA: NAD(P)-dependent oxidoreductase [Bacteroidales bacterium]|nr:NAD(P)-dependent oxidoreductase [Bacteroidales bacterium]
MKILVTGGSGFIGTNYIDYARKKGAEILNIDIVSPHRTEDKSKYINCNIMDREKLASVITDFKPTHVVHLAAKTGAHSITDIREFAPNIQGVQNLIEALIRAGSVERVIFTSTLLVCRMGYMPKDDTDYMPSTAYGASKVEGEKIVRKLQDSAFDWTIIRPISVWGPWMGEPYLRLFKFIKRGMYFHIGQGHYIRSMGYVENIAHEIHSILLAPREKVHKKTFYVGDPIPVDLYEFSETVREKLSGPKIRHIPLSMIRLLAWSGDLLKIMGWKDVPMSTFRLNNILTQYSFDLSPVMAICDALPYDLVLSIERTVSWFNGEEYRYDKSR